jgi:hypothetical protein
MLSHMQWGATTLNPNLQRVDDLPRPSSFGLHCDGRHNSSRSIRCKQSASDAVIERVCSKNRLAALRFALHTIGCQTRHENVNPFRRCVKANCAGDSASLTYTWCMAVHYNVQVGVHASCLRKGQGQARP